MVVPLETGAAIGGNKLKSKINMLITTRKNADRQFIELYLSILTKHQEKHLKQIETNLSTGKSIISSLSQKLLAVDVDVEVLSLFQKLQNNSTATIKSFNNFVCQTTAGKVGVTTENNSTWQHRMNTCNVSPCHNKYECLNVPLTIENAKIIEALAFAILQHYRLKINNKKTKSAQGEFFRLFIEIEEKTISVIQDIENSKSITMYILLFITTNLKYV